MTNHFLFVYGTLRAGDGHPMSAWLRRNATPCGAASFQGRLYGLGRYPGAVPSVRPAERVSGELYRLHRQAHFLRLDRYEGCAGGALPAEYLRRVVTVDCGGLPVEAWIYLYDRPVRFKRRLRSGDWLRPGLCGNRGFMGRK